MSDDRKLLPTPTTSDSRGARQGGAHDENVRVPRLAAAVEVDLPAELAARRHMLPTPVAQDGNGHVQDPSADVGNNGRSVSLGDVVSRLPQDEGNALLPTPNAGLGLNNRAQGSPPAERAAAGHSVTLADVACHLDAAGPLLSTPQSRDWKNESGGKFKTLPRDLKENAVGGLFPVPPSPAEGLMPTPTSSDGSGGGIRTGLSWENTTKSTGEGGASRLRDVVGLLVEQGELLPTPRSRDAKGATSSRSGDNKHDLPSALAPAPMLPTPAARDGLPATEETMQRQKDRGYGPNLNDVAANYLPTPKARDWTGHGPSSMERNTPDLNAISRILENDLEVPVEESERLLPTPAAADGVFIVATDTGYRDDAQRSWAQGREEGQWTSVGSVTRRTSDQLVDLLPTPTTQDGANNGGPSQFERNTLPLNAEVMLLPTPSASDGVGGGPNNPNNRVAQGHHVQLLDMGMASVATWGKYEPAIHRWEQLTRRAPWPTEPNKNGNPRLAAAFSEWMMGWPEGWVTDPDIGISRNDQLRIVGNGVCPQQTEAALRYLLTVAEVAGSRGQDFARAGREGSGGDDLVTTAVKLENAVAWGKYEAAIRCWERVTRPAPAPTELNKNGNPRLAAGFSEWLMGWPEGHVTDPEIGISRNDQLRITGNGVVPQQCAHALRILLRMAWENP